VMDKTSTGRASWRGNWVGVLSTLASVVAGAGVFTLLNARWDALTAWKVYLYFGLFAAHLLAERLAYRGAEGAGQQRHAWTRHALFTLWWLVMFGAPLEYALWPRESLAVTVVGAALAVAGAILRVWSIRALGRYFSGHIETQPGHRVVESGPYRLIRHPAYAGNVLLAIGMPLVLDAALTLIPAVLLAALFVYRIPLEEAALAENVPGYRGYMARTDRLIPGIW
jgi:protein-S-isoprenylcysteine O-methyltransferase Ste14